MNPDRREFLRLSDGLARQADSADDCRHFGQFERRIPSTTHPKAKRAAVRLATCRQIPVAAMLMAGMGGDKNKVLRPRPSTRTWACRRRSSMGALRSREMQEPTTD